MGVLRGLARRLRDVVRRAGAEGPDPSTPGEQARPFQDLASPWDWQRLLKERDEPVICNICGWAGPSFEGGMHSESAVCAGCGSISRDRFLFFSFVRRAPRARYRVLETSPRLGEPYRRAMRRWFEYSASDFDLRSHKADMVVDLQDIDLDDGSVDVLLTPHVLEHVPDTDKALQEIHRVLATGGRMYLQVPVLQGKTARPIEPEFHGDNTPVEWRFGPDLTDRLRRHGFDARILCGEQFVRVVEQGTGQWPTPVSGEYDIESLLAASSTEDLLPIADEETARRFGFEPAYMFLTWEGIRVEKG